MRQHRCGSGVTGTVAALLLVCSMHLAWAQVEEGGLVRIPAPQLEKLSIRHPQGSLVLRGWDKPEIHISFHKRALSSAMLGLLRVQVEMNQGEVRVRSGIETRGELRSLPQPDASIDLVMDIPRDAQVLASTFHGAVSASGFRGSVDLGSQTGAIRVSDISGEVRTHAGTGDQWLQSIQGAVRATGLDGDMELSGIEGPSLIAQVVRGQISARDVRVQVVRLQTTLGTLLLLGALTPGGLYELHVHEGDIRVALQRSPDLHFTLDAHGGGAVDSAFPLSPGAVRTANSLRGDFHGGGPVLRLAATQGQIHLAPLP